MLLVVGILLFGYVYYPVVQSEIHYQTKHIATEIVPVDSQLGIIIPKIDANAPIIPHISPTDSAVYQQALTKGVAHAAGTVLPGDRGTSFLFSHSSVNILQARTYNSVFYLLHHVDVGDEITIYRLGTPLHFKIESKKVVEPSAISYLTETSDYPRLILMTCWPAGTDLKRLVVEAVLSNPR